MEAEESAAPKAGVCTDSDSEDQSTTSEDTAPDPNNQAIKAEESTASTELAMTAEESSLPNAKSCFAVSRDVAAKTDKNISKAGTPSSKEFCRKRIECGGPKTEDRIVSPRSVVAMIPEENLNTAAASNIIGGSNFCRSRGSQKSVSHEIRFGDLYLLLRTLRLVGPNSAECDESEEHTSPLSDIDSSNLTDSWEVISVSEYAGSSDIRDAVARYERARPSNQNGENDRGRAAYRRAQSGKPPNRSQREYPINPDSTRQRKAACESVKFKVLRNVEIYRRAQSGKPQTRRRSEYPINLDSTGQRKAACRRSRERTRCDPDGLVRPRMSTPNDRYRGDFPFDFERGLLSIVEDGASVETIDLREQRQVREWCWYRNTDFMVLTGLHAIIMIFVLLKLCFRLFG